MTRLDPAARSRLAARGISIWERRVDAAKAAAAASAAGSRAEPAARVRLASGEGDWLLVQRQPWRGDADGIVNDLRAWIGPARCRFGQWVIDSQSGEDGPELSDRGVRHILSFGPAPGTDWPGLIETSALAELAADWRARRALWQLLAPVLARS
ncbi:MAG: hypothetical protein LAT56_01875 [Wenzhouxiangella sp.]|nr:hypothetical protein [Wenzhouxiangella sp.]